VTSHKTAPFFASDDTAFNDYAGRINWSPRQSIAPKRLEEKGCEKLNPENHLKRVDVLIE
jgi:hypothetical protein